MVNGISDKPEWLPHPTIYGHCSCLRLGFLPVIYLCSLNCGCGVTPVLLNYKSETCLPLSEGWKGKCPQAGLLSGCKAQGSWARAASQGPRGRVNARPGARRSEWLPCPSGSARGLSGGCVMLAERRLRRRGGAWRKLCTWGASSHPGAAGLWSLMLIWY